MLIGFPAVNPNLTLISNQGPDISHPDHRPPKIPPKNPMLVAVLVHQIIRLTTNTAEQSLIRLQQPSLLHQIMEIPRVEPCRGLIQGGQVGVSAGLRTGQPASTREAGVDVVSVSGVIVNAASEEAALREAECVGAGENDEVLGLETLLLEGVDELR